MATLIIPAAGQSSRYGLSAPKFLLPHPNGLSMVAAGLTHLNTSKLDEVVVVSLRSYFADIDEAKFLLQIESVTGINARLVLLDQPTSSMVDTVCFGIETIAGDPPIVVKDVDNLISASVETFIGENFVTYANLVEFPGVTPVNKSFVEIDAHGFIENIVEKRIISGEINTGLIGFSSASSFLRAASFIRPAREKFVSDIVRYLLSNGEVFQGLVANLYEDWGVLDDWKAYSRKYCTIFVDFEGIVHERKVINDLAKPDSEVLQIQSNISSLLKLARGGTAVIVFCSTRDEGSRANVSEQLNKMGFEHFQLLMGLPIARKFVVSAYSEVTDYPAAIALNLETNAQNLEALVKIVN